MTNPSAPGLFLAVDAGGTSTRAAALDPSGECVGIGRAGSGNPTSAGRDAAVAAIREAVRAALGEQGPAHSAVLAVAGHRGHEPAIVDGLAPLVSGEIRFEGDLLAAYCSGTASSAGHALVAGTGAAAIRVCDGRIAAVADGIGWLLGDVGSGFWIGRKVVRAALAPLEGRGPATSLTSALMAALGVRLDPDADREDGRPAGLQQAVSILYARPPLRLADHAGLAFEAAATRDAVATGILDEAAAGLRRTLAAVRDPAADTPLVLGGSVLARQPAFADAVAPGAIVAADGLPGAAVLALRRGGVRVDGVRLARITASLEAWRGGAAPAAATRRDERR